ncbi:MAG: peptide chain release factor N(5)-glutamine methyltransferase [Pseudomonadota bacterium]|nr:peptide chain release factor N(5)-glutamine methyltransferase [Pseudomonadota bacterium]
MMDTVAENLRDGARTLMSCSESPRLDAELLLGKVLGLPRSALIARGDDRVAADERRTFIDLLERRLDGAPVAYLTGTREFWSLPLTVTPAVLVPRPETELLVELALALLPKDRQTSVLDLGTGSGAIALAIASERPHARLTGVDISAPALDVAAQNSRDLALANTEWLPGSWFGAVPDRRFDMIVANPPYIAAGDPALANLSKEPAHALNCGATGMEALAAIAAEAPAHLQQNGWLIMEHGSDQASQVAQLLERHGFSAVRSHLDFSRNPRVTLGVLHTQHQEQT